jgi:glyoxylase-like metal-dependent hydrolase (beta-lactamase superfamily II)
MIKVYHLNCSLPHTRGFDLSRLNRPMCCHCLLLETSHGLALVDTGFSKSLAEEGFRKVLLSTNHDPFRTALTEIKSLGFKAQDVQHIFVTHLDHDHVGGVTDFPWAKIYVHTTEYEFHKKINDSLQFKMRFQPKLWRGAQIQCLAEGGEKWFQFQSVRAPKEFLDEILMIPLFGHTAGHCGFAIKQKKGWLLHAGDSFYLKEDLAIPLAERSFFSEALALSLAIDTKKRIYNLEQLRILNKDKEHCQIINSHDSAYLMS